MTATPPTAPEPIVTAQSTPHRPCPAGCPHPLSDHCTLGCASCPCRYGQPRFPLGRLSATRRAVIVLARHSAEIASLIARHAAGDWGDIHPHLADLNNEALATGGLLHSTYILDPATELWIITEPDRSATTVLLPDEY
jgi:hypothetical protein